MKAEISFTPEDLEQIRLLIRDELSKSTAKEVPKYYTIEETCDLLKISKPTFHAWKNKDAIKTVKIQGRVLVTELEINRLSK